MMVLSILFPEQGTFSHVPKERVGFKLRGGIDKQTGYTGGLYIERCFGILLAPGRSVKHSDMRLLDMVSGSSGGSACSVCALWNAGESALAAFNVASGDGAPAYMSLALDLVIRGIPDPLRWTGPRPRALNQLVRVGVPEALRGERDITRTFPAHGFYREDGGLGQDSLLRLARAYAVYDEEVGYCQGLSFLAATLLLHTLLRLARAYAVYDEEVGYCQGLSFLAATLLLHTLLRLARAYAVYDEEVGYSQGLSFLAATRLLHIHHTTCSKKSYNC
ncbi:putative rab6 gtpase activating protein, gapcena [Operophtera brumata]|uniref:Putative rab6 gtpase activating protein, gapcena n=1 Tax=Operophtera brumata TaxID=104452 RepID=A0A0L7L9V5_OPEBR|nr:putative rab6 gtpase activating protein, gapcena [Operophtera brumata]